METPPNDSLQKRNGVLEDVSAEIGYTATNALVDWFGGGWLFIPFAPDADHVIAKTIGYTPFSRLVKMFDGHVANERLLWVPTGYEREIARRDRMIATFFTMGMGTKDIAGITYMSERHIQVLRSKLEDMGILPLILRRTGLKIPQDT